METLEGLVRRIVNSLNNANLDYMLTGALVSSHYGTPRTTTDVDIVVAVSKKETQDKLVQALKKAGLEVQKEKMTAALKSGFRIATFRDSKSPFTLDIILSNKKLKKQAGTILGLPTFFQTPEELILAKLRMIEATTPKERAFKDEEDVKAILKFTKVNMNAIKRQARKNNTLSTLKALGIDTIG